LKEPDVPSPFVIVDAVEVFKMASYLLGVCFGGPEVGRRGGVGGSQRGVDPVPVGTLPPLIAPLINFTNLLQLMTSNLFKLLFRLNLQVTTCVFCSGFFFSLNINTKKSSTLALGANEVAFRLMNKHYKICWLKSELSQHWKW